MVDLLYPPGTGCRSSRLDPPLGSRLLELRSRIAKSGAPALGWDEIEEEEVAFYDAFFSAVSRWATDLAAEARARREIDEASGAGISRGSC
jgi:hypothetical protein